jgi:hypothetical protein
MVPALFGLKLEPSVHKCSFLLVLLRFQVCVSVGAPISAVDCAALVKPAKNGKPATTKPPFIKFGTTPIGSYKPYPFKGKETCETVFSQMTSIRKKYLLSLNYNISLFKCGTAAQLYGKTMCLK